VSDLGPSRYLPLLRRGLDFPDQGRHFQDGQLQPDRAGGQGQDRELQQQEAGRSSMSGLWATLRAPEWTIIHGGLRILWAGSSFEPVGLDWL
jgi:hypothetical protein